MTYQADFSLGHVCQSETIGRMLSEISQEISKFGIGKEAWDFSEVLRTREQKLRLEYFKCQALD